MARGDLVKKMFQSYQRGDDPGFRAAAEEIIADEEKKNHSLLANELRRTLEGAVRPRALQVASLKPLPKARDDAPLLILENPVRTLDDTVLQDRSRTQVLNVVREFRNASVLRAHALRPRNRVLFVGPPGCGKSITAEALASELGLPLARVALPTVVSSFLGDTSRNLDAIFRFCESGSWVLLFEEFDALAKERSDRAEHGELKRVVTAFLQLLDDFHGDSLIIAATNHPQLLDEAVWRRFDDVVAFGPPSVDELARLLELKLRTMPHSLPLADVARRLVGFSQAEVELVCLDTLRHVVIDGRKVVAAEDIDRAIRDLTTRRETILTFETAGDGPHPESYDTPRA